MPTKSQEQQQEEHRQYQKRFTFYANTTKIPDFFVTDINDNNKRYKM